MSMHQGMDLSRFKKVASDKKTSTLRHVKGHEIKIAHAGLTPMMRDVLANMPVHLANGAGPLEAMDPASPATAVDTPAEVPVPEAPAPLPEPAIPLPDPTAPVEAPAAAAAPPAAAANNDPINVIGQDLENQDKLFAQDVLRGHIKPETIKSLYAKQDTLGKIGTLFGLLVSGAGSGLTGQPNAVMEMMNRQIENDMKSQQHSNENAQNWLRLTQAHHMQKAQRKLTGAQTEEAKTHAEKTKSDEEFVNSQTALNWARLGSAGWLQQQFIDKMPPGRARDRAQGTFNNVLVPGLDKINSANNVKTEQVLKARKAMRGAAPGAAKTAPDQSPIDFGKITALEKQGRFAGDLGAGELGHTIAAANQEAGRVMQNRQLYDTWKKAWTQFDNAFAAGELNEADREAVILTLSGQMGKLMGNQTLAEQEKLKKSMFPAKGDFGRTRQDKIDYMTDHFRQLEADVPTLTRLKAIRPFPAPPVASKSKTSSLGGAVSSVIGKGESVKAAGKSGTESYKTVNGVKYKRGPNGEAIPVK